MRFLLVLNVGLFAVAVASYQAQTFQYSGVYGGQYISHFSKRPACGDTGRTCVTREASCTDNGCACASETPKGKGDFRCYNEQTLYCEMKNDPVLRTYSGESTNFPFPCRYLASHVKTETTKYKSQKGYKSRVCEAKVYAMNIKHKGKFAVYGFDLMLRIKSPGLKMIESSLRQLALSRNYRAMNETQELKHGGFNFCDLKGRRMSFKHGGIQIDVRRKRENNQYFFKIINCGITVSFVPYDCALRRDQKQVPGLSVAVDLKYSPKFLSLDKSVCLVPKDQGGYEVKDIAVKGLNLQQWLFLLAFKAQHTGMHPFGPEYDYVCDSLGAEVSYKCHVYRKKEAMINCDWMLSNAHFMKCYDTSVHALPLLKLFASCVNAWCSERPCTQTISDIRASGCDGLKTVPEMAKFMAGQMCPPQILHTKVVY